jgi:DNA repair photolyase
MDKGCCVYGNPESEDMCAYCYIEEIAKNIKKEPEVIEHKVLKVLETIERG